jgi:hypothetical protein
MSLQEDQLQRNQNNPGSKRTLSFVQLFNRTKSSETSRDSFGNHYSSKACFAFYLTLVFYFVSMACAVGMIVISVKIVFLPNPGFYQKVYSIGMFVIGSGLILIFLVRNPAGSLHKLLRDLIRTQIVLSTLDLGQKVRFREIDKLQNQDNLDQKQIKSYITSLHEDAERAIKNLYPPEDWLD